MKSTFDIEVVGERPPFAWAAYRGSVLIGSRTHIRTTLGLWVSVWTFALIQRWKAARR